MNGATSKPPCDRDDAVAVLQRLRQNGHEAYFAGGCVRDMLLGLQPADYDIATDAPPKRVRELFTQTQAVGAAFGVILVRHRKSVIEVATFRSEGPYLDGRRPSQIQFATAQQDAQRRDFTINGLFFDPLENRVIDYVGGQADLQARVLRAIGDPTERFREDHLRLLRAVRFAARFDLRIEPNTEQSILAASTLLKRISPERIAGELRLMLTPPTRSHAWRLLWRMQLIQEVFRTIIHVDRVELVEDRSIFLNLSPGEPVSFGLALAVGVLCYVNQLSEVSSDVRGLLSDSAARRYMKSARQLLRISNDEADEMQQTMAGAFAMLQEQPPTLAAQKRFLATPTAPSTRRLLGALAATGFHSDRVRYLESAFSALVGCDCAPPPLITGDDLAAAGLTPGPAFRRILETVYDAQLEDRVQTKDQAMALARSIAEG